MKVLTSLFSAALLITAVPAQSATIRVYLQGGQSNADGRALVSGLPAALQVPQADVPFYYYFQGGPTTGGLPGTLTTLRPGASETGVTNFGPEITFGRSLADSVVGSGQSVAIIKFANGGTSLNTHWKAGGTPTTTNDGAEYVTFQNVVNAGLTALQTAYPGDTIQLAGMTWVQGETDIDNGAAASTAYGTNLINFITDVRQTFGANLPFFLSRISDNQTVYSAGSATAQTNYNSVRAGQASAAATLPGVYLIDTDPAAFSVKADNLHYDAAGQQALGTALAQSAIAAVPEPASGLTATLALGLWLYRRRAARD